MENNIPKKNKSKFLINANDAFVEGYIQISTSKIFVALFNKIPSFIDLKKLSIDKIIPFLQEKYGDKFAYLHKSQSYKNKELKTDVGIVLLSDDLMLKYEYDDAQIYYNIDNEDAAIALSKEISQFKKEKKNKHNISFIVSAQYGGLDTQELKIKKPDIDFELNYNDDLIPIHNIIVERLSNKDEKGIVFLYGEPGTGKTTYIRYLVSVIQKEVIFLPKNIAENLAHHDLMNFLLDHKNAILIIEDAEQLIMDRAAKTSSPVAALLNITDGLLSDVLNIQIICTFNTQVENIDQALLRKGRLIAAYEFSKLNTAKANILAKTLGKEEIVYNTPQLLTEIYNGHETTHHIKKKGNKIGFNPDYALGI